jgi:uncharacterized oxidoreductase
MIHGIIISSKGRFMKLTGHTILITGAGSGIGSGLAKAFHKEGNKVIISGRRKPTLKAFADKHKGMDFFSMDISKDADIQKLYKFISKKYPKLDALINNADIWKNQDFTKAETLTKHLFDEIDINLKGLIRMTQVFLPLLSKQSDSVLMNVSSGLAYMPLSMAPVYCATKAGVHSFSMSLRHQLRKTSVTVIELAPPAVETDLVKCRAKKMSLNIPSWA